MNELENASKERGYTDEVRANMRNVLFNDKYAALPEADRDEAFLRDCEVFITGLDMNRDAAQNLYDIERVVDCVGAMYGYKSDQFNRISMFVFENFQREKNSMGNAAPNHLDKWFLDGHSYSSNEGQKILNENPRLREVYHKVLTLAQEIPYDGSAWFDEMKKLEPIARNMVAYAGITSADGFQQGAVAALDTAKKMQKEKAAAQAVAVKTPWEEATDRSMSAFEEEASEIGARAILEYVEAHPDASYGKIRRVRDEAVSDYWYGKAKEVTSGFAALGVRVGQTAYPDQNISKNKRYVRDELLYQNKNSIKHFEYDKSVRDALSAVESEIKEADLEDEYRIAVGPSKSALGSYDELLEKIKIGRDVLKKAREKKARAQKEEEAKKSLIDSAIETTKKAAKRNNLHGNEKYEH